MRRTSTIAVALFAAACNVVPASPDTQPTARAASVQGQLGDTVRIGLHKSASFDDGRFRLVFDSLGTDSRCPADAICVRQGDLPASFVFESTTGYRPVTLHTGQEPRSAAYFGYRVDLVTVEPYPGTYDRSAPAPAPVAVVVVKRN